jgi:hypothetical protein
MQCIKLIRVRDMSTNKETISGLAGGLIGGALATFGLMKIAKPALPAITSGKTKISPQSVSAGGSATLLPSTTYKFAVILFHGDGEPQVTLSVKVGTATYTLNGDEQAIEVVANEAVEITATNTDTANPHNTMTIEVAYLTW